MCTYYLLKRKTNIFLTIFVQICCHFLVAIINKNVLLQMYCIQVFKLYEVGIGVSWGFILQVFDWNSRYYKMIK